MHGHDHHRVQTVGQGNALRLQLPLPGFLKSVPRVGALLPKTEHQGEPRQAVRVRCQTAPAHHGFRTRVEAFRAQLGVVPLRKELPPGRPKVAFPFRRQFQGVLGRQVRGGTPGPGSSGLNGQFRPRQTRLGLVRRGQGRHPKVDLHALAQHQRVRREYLNFFIHQALHHGGALFVVAHQHGQVLPPPARRRITAELVHQIVHDVLHARAGGFACGRAYLNPSAFRAFGDLFHRFRCVGGAVQHSFQCAAHGGEKPVVPPHNYLLTAPVLAQD